MAMSKIKSLPSGASSAYHKIGMFFYNGGRIEGEIHSYLNADAKNSGKLPIEITSFEIKDASDFQSTKLTPFEYIYKYIMNSDELGFLGSVKV